MECLDSKNSKFSICLMDQGNVFKNKNKIIFLRYDLWLLSQKYNETFEDEKNHTNLQIIIFIPMPLQTTKPLLWQERKDLLDKEKGFLLTNIKLSPLFWAALVTNNAVANTDASEYQVGVYV